MVNKKIMKPPHLTFLIAAITAWTVPAFAQQPAQDAQTAYQYAMDTAEAGYDATKARCDALAGVPHEICVADARATRIRIEEEATAAHKNTLAAYTRARMRIATAFHERDKTRCSALVGNDRDVCLAQAKATLVAIQADARADRKAIEARLDANDAKIEAEYRVAMQKCDAFAGAVKDGCVSTARTAYGK